MSAPTDSSGGVDGQHDDDQRHVDQSTASFDRLQEMAAAAALAHASSSNIFLFETASPDRVAHFWTTADCSRRLSSPLVVIVALVVVFRSRRRLGANQVLGCVDDQKNVLRAISAGLIEHDGGKPKLLKTTRRARRRRH